MLWLRKSSLRRQAIRDDVVEAESLARIDRRGIGPALAMAALFFILATLIVYYPRESLPYRIGDRPPTALRARVDFSMNVDDAQDFERIRENERARAPQVLLINEPAFTRIGVQLHNLRLSVQGAKGAAAVSASMREQFPGLDDRAVQMLQAPDETPQAFALKVDLLLSALHKSCPIVDPAVTARLAKRVSEGRDWVVLSASPTFNPQALSSPLTGRDVVSVRTTDVAELRRLRDVVAHAMPDQLVDPITAYLAHLDDPTFVDSAVLTERLADFRALEARPKPRKYAAEDVIVAAGEVITPPKYALLVEAQRAYETSLAKDSPWTYLLSRIGEAAVVLVLTAAGVIYVTRMHHRSTTVGRGWALCGLLLLTLFIAKNATVLLPQTTYLLGIAPTLLATVILIVVFDQRFALAVAAIHGLIVTLALGQSFDFFLTMLTGIAVFAFSLTEIRTRAKLIEVGVFASAGLFVSVWALGLARMTGNVWSTHASTDITSLALDSLRASGAGVLVGFVTLGILPFVESVFKITTSMRLLEYCDASHPLLRRLAQEAPGTFNHSLTVGIMAESAADAICANGLLCRAGAYYHDVGKLSKPHYFIENQAGGPNRHEKLSPAMSLLIIVGHVKDGIELAREYSLPWILHQFIGQHHGTTLVEYFYHAARRRQEAEGEDATEVRDSEFRYPGPKPQTQEAAILMICDGVESIVRGLGDPSAGKIEATVHNLVIKRLMDGQFSECDLTLRELSIIEAALTKSLAGIYHGRIPYPEPASVSQPA